MSEQEQRTVPLGEAAEACRECGATLAADQRYCLNCGRRRGKPRVDFHEHLPADDTGAQNGVTPTPAVPPASAATPPVTEKHQRDYAPLAAVGGIAVLGLMLLIGVLIGKGNGEATTSAPPQIVRVQDESAGGPVDDEGAESKGSPSKQAKAKGSGKGAKNAGKGAAAPVEASDAALQELQEQSPEEYQESSAKLPDEIATGGAPPPTDSKAPGAGSKGTAIE